MVVVVVFLVLYLQYEHSSSSRLRLCTGNAIFIYAYRSYVLVGQCYGVHTAVVLAYIQSVQELAV